MIPSKRLVVSPEDFSALEQQITEPEYLIEMTLTDSARPGGVIDAYKEAGLPSSGINISASMMQLMNSLNTMLIVAVALVVAIVLAVVAILALRYTVFAAIETDLAQIAALKAIGAPLRGIRRLYVAKYLALSAVGATLGYAVGQSLATALEAPTTLYLGRPATTPWSVGLPILTVLVLALGVIGFTWLALRRIGRISAIEALRSGTSASLRPRRQRWRLAALRRLPVQVWLGAREALRPSNALLLGILALCTFTMVLPVNVATTLDDPRIATYLGVGEADLRIDVRAGTQELSTVESAVTDDPRVSTYTTVLRRNYKMRTQDGEWESVLIDIGDHNAFPMKYMSGRSPNDDSEVSLSYNQAKATSAEVGSTVTVRTADGDKDLTVTGIYQDITNNGSTAKATFDDGAPALWQLMYANVKDKNQESAVADDLQRDLPGVQVNGMSEYASEFFGATSSQVRLIAGMACAIALGLAFLITVLFTVLVLSREKPQVGILRALGCTQRAIAGQYFTRFGLLTVTGIGLGLLLAATLGLSAVFGLMACTDITQNFPLLLACCVLLSAMSAVYGCAMLGLSCIVLPHRERGFGGVIQTMAARGGKMIGGALVLWLYQEYGQTAAAGFMLAFTLLMLLQLLCYREPESPTAPMTRRADGAKSPTCIREDCSTTSNISTLARKWRSYIPTSSISRRRIKRSRSSAKWRCNGRRLTPKPSIPSPTRSIRPKAALTRRDFDQL